MYISDTACSETLDVTKLSPFFEHSSITKVKEDKFFPEGRYNRPYK